jgi:hypothetical protein
LGQFEQFAPLKIAEPDLVDGSRERAACAESVSEVENLSFWESIEPEQF